MKIVDFQEFASMPSGTIFSYFEPANCQGLYRKGKTIYDGKLPIDYYQESLVADCWNGDDPTVGDCAEIRWGKFDFDQQYAIYEPPDIKYLVSLLDTSKIEPKTTQILRDFHACVVATLTAGDTQFPANISKKATEVMDFLENDKMNHEMKGEKNERE